MENTSILIQMTKSEFKIIIQDIVTETLKDFSAVINTIPKSTDDELLTRDQVKDILKVSYTTLFHWNRDGVLPNIKRGRKVYYYKKDVMGL